MIMRATVGICGKDIERVVETYHLMSERSFTHASPTLFNAKSSARLLLPCLYEGWLDRRHVWHSRDTQAVRHDQQNCWWCWPKHSLGMSTGYFHVITFLWFVCLPARSYIARTNGYSNGIIPTLCAHDATARYVDQGDNKPPGAFAIYLACRHFRVPWR